MDEMKSILELAKDNQLERFLGRHGAKFRRKKRVKCNICGREMETVFEENPPFYCWKCGDKHELGGFHEM